MGVVVHLSIARIPPHFLISVRKMDVLVGPTSTRTSRRSCDDQTFVYTSFTLTDLVLMFVLNHLEFSVPDKILSLTEIPLPDDFPPQIFIRELE